MLVVASLLIVVLKLIEFKNISKEEDQLLAWVCFMSLFIDPQDTTSILLCIYMEICTCTPPHQH